MMLARFRMKKGCVIPAHSHTNEQLSYLLEGALKFSIDGQEIVVRAGEGLCIPLTYRINSRVGDTVALDVFNPPRQDWIDKTDAYLKSNAPDDWLFLRAVSYC
jgi:quercetin dioxygenase-like cupin family protein